LLAMSGFQDRERHWQGERRDKRSFIRMDNLQLPAD
jgi:hypothetical protein